MFRLSKVLCILAALAMLSGCGQSIPNDIDYGPNPFLTGLEEGKEDTGYLNLRGFEVHVTLEADVTASSWRIFDAPAELAQFAVTYLRKRDNFYLEILAEDATASDRVEWLVEGEWLTSEQARGVDKSKLTHFRMQEVNAVVLNSQADNIQAGKVFEAEVPLKPYSIMSDADDKCADYNSHIELSQGVYWYLWNPRKYDCPDELTQTMTLTVSEVLPNDPESYPEYDRLWEDGKLTAAVFFAKLDDGDVADDYNWDNFEKLSTWLSEAGFSEIEDAPMGKRFSKTSGELTVEIDVYGPDVFHSVADYSRFNNWQRAVSEHEIIMYNGHSVLGTGYAFERADYPDTYQIFQIASCLSYEYYVRPVLAGKGGWENVDVLSNVQPTYYSENFPLTTTVLAKLIWGFENQGRASWEDIMEAVSRRLGHARFGVSGARGNCWSPSGDRCHTDPDPDPDEFVYESTEIVDIPDNQSDGALSKITVPDSFAIGSLEVELDIGHTYVGDLEIVLSHASECHTLWNREGASADDIHEVFTTGTFDGSDAAGDWILRVVDHAGYDVGQIEGWSLTLVPAGHSDPDPVEDLRFEDQANMPIPDNDAQGISRSIAVPDAVSIARLKVELELAHTYVGDLEIVLSHGGTAYALWDRSGGGNDDIRQEFMVSVFDGSEAQGEWTLEIADRAGLDTGTLESWALVITPAR